MAVRLFEGKNHAASYLQYRVAPHELISKIMSYMEKRTPSQFKLAVDVGCGPGQGTVLLASYFTKVVGTDISQAMVERALAKSNPPNISYRQCPAEELPFTSGQVDLVTAMTAAHWFDRPRFLQEANRVLRPGGCLALLSYSMDMNLEYGDVSDTLNDICQEFYTALLPYRSSYLGPSSKKIYFDMFNSCSYPDKEWTEFQPVRRTLSVNGFIGMVETFSSYQKLKQKDPSEAEHLSNRFQRKLLTAMNTTSPDTEVTVIVNYFHVLACKPLSD
ncbi:putative methyltransferase DDB_G0268948 [Girardinichthys multiradiatus]|uniref:putative methyltransferase DDB_G0268948 n=1 Tax=Girardinichthys multiradiatus TaxID=208333 RepID=UPI001FADAC68|nr:putative methyltransferase DDB_G0268948 [Girardinichthys multiradiatus]XP_047211567.1 putative methyltransferase DDB_G0268948 [Girardinichthys multiradiatus]XP_047211568.1 putative methyltransferase DDB_G0268948 [Girardinichthys multiradiatus]XP_047211569.1 putative methyltransferase DDB_G0268948 [Girardinichthys multiradiatus]